MAVILELSQNQPQGYVPAGSVPPAMQSGAWSFTFTPALGSDDFDFFVFQRVMSFGTTGSIYIGRAGSSALFGVDFGGGNVYDQAADWNAGAPLTLSFDLASGLFTASGFTSGNGTYATYPLGLPAAFPSGALYIGQQPNGAQPFQGTFSNVTSGGASNNSVASAGASLAGLDAASSGTVYTAILELSRNQAPGYVPSASVPAQMLDGRWSFTFVPSHESATWPEWTRETVLSFDGTQHIELGRDGGAPYFVVDLGGGNIYIQAASWAAGAPITLTMDLVPALFTAQGLLTGDGTYAIYPLGVPVTLTTGPLWIGQQPDGSRPFAGSIGNVIGTATSTAIVGSASGSVELVASAAAGVEIAGTAAAEVPGLEFLALTNDLGAQGAAELPDLLVVALGEMGWDGESAFDLPELEASAVGTVEIGGTAEVTLDELVVEASATAIVYIDGAAAATLPELELFAEVELTGTKLYAPAGQTYTTETGIVVTESGAYVEITPSITRAIRQGKLLTAPDDGPLAPAMADDGILYARPYLSVPITDVEGTPIAEGGTLIQFSRRTYNNVLRGDLRTIPPESGMPPILGTGVLFAASLSAAAVGGVLNPVIGTVAAQCAGLGVAAVGNVVYPYLGVVSAICPGMVASGSGTVSSAGVLGFAQASLPSMIAAALGASDGVIIPGLVNSASSGDNRTAIQNALNSAPAGRRLLIPAGTYRVSGSINVDNVNVTVQGAGPGLTTLLMTSATDHSWRVYANNHTLRGLTIQTQGVSGRGDLDLNGHSTICLDGSANRGGGTGCDGFLGEDCVFSGAKAAGVFAFAASNYTFRRCTSQYSLADSWHNTAGSNYGLFEDCKAQFGGDDMMAFVFYSGQQSGTAAHHHIVRRFAGRQNTHGRGLAIINCNNILVEDIYIEKSSAAGIIVAHESYTGGNPHPAIHTVTVRQTVPGGVRLKGCNYEGPNSNPAEPDHGSIIIVSDNSQATISGVSLQDVNIVDTAQGRVPLTTVAVQVTVYGGATIQADIPRATFWGTNPTLYGSNVGGGSSITRPNWVNNAGQQPGAYPFPLFGEGGVPTPPSGQLLMVDRAGNYVVNRAGDYLTGKG